MGGKIFSLLNYSFSPFSFCLVLKEIPIYMCYEPKHICQSSSGLWFSVNKRKFFLNLFPFKNSDLALGETQPPSSKKVSWRKGFWSSQETTFNGDFFIWFSADRLAFVTDFALIFFFELCKNFPNSYSVKDFRTIIFLKPFWTLGHIFVVKTLF